jgi:hypothetical protein
VKLVLYLIAGMIGFLGFMFLVGSQVLFLRLIVGGALLAGGIALVYVTRQRPTPSQTTTVQKIDLSGDVNLEEFRCNSCNAPLSKEMISVEAGAIMVECGHCGSTYQLEEEPKW